MLTPIEFEQLLTDLEQLAGQDGQDSKLAKAVGDNLNQIKAVMLEPKTPANKTRLLELITIGKNLTGDK